MNILRDKFRGCLIGLACGDAVGATNELKPRANCDVSDMVGGGPWRLRPGDWTDDTSMAFALGASLVNRRGFDARDIMRNWLQWRDGEAFCGTHGRGCFDSGGTTSRALAGFRNTGDPWQGSQYSAANGCLMRFAPVALFGYSLPPAERRKLAADSSRLTHAHPLCVASTVVLGEFLHKILTGEEITSDAVQGLPKPLTELLERGAWEDETPHRIKSGGYVLDTLEAAMWATYRATDFRSAVLRAANLGDDADTVAAVAGQIAGAEFGYSGIPADWRLKLDRHDELLAIADALYEIATESRDTEHRTFDLGGEA